MDKLRAVVLSARPIHWIKNVLILFPAIAAHEFDKITNSTMPLIAMMAFSLVASATYLVNDLADFETDSSYITKKYRPLVSGKILKFDAVFFAILFLFAGFSLAYYCSILFISVIAVYFVLNIAYTFYFKKIFFWDVLFLAAFYLLRLWAGAVLFGISLTCWFLLFFLFMFLSLGFLKRLAEINLHESINLPGRSYGSNKTKSIHVYINICILFALGTYAFYILAQGNDSLYKESSMLWFSWAALFEWCRFFLGKKSSLQDDIFLCVMREPRTYIVLAVTLVVIKYAGN